MLPFPTTHAILKKTDELRPWHPTNVNSIQKMETIRQGKESAPPTKRCAKLTKIVNEKTKQKIHGPNQHLKPWYETSTRRTN